MESIVVAGLVILFASIYMCGEEKGRITALQRIDSERQKLYNKLKVNYRIFVS